MWRGLALAFLLILCGCSGKETSTIAPGPDRIVRLADAEIRGLDPQTISDLAGTRVAADQFEGLTRFDGRGEAVAGLAQDWIVSADGRIWTFLLRPSLRFSDGEPISARTFAQGWQRLNAPETASPHKALFAAIADIQASSDSRVIVRLHEPVPGLPALLAHPALAALPLHRIAAKGAGWTAERPLVTSGPYRLAEWRLNDHVRLARNPAWHGGKAPIGTIIWRPVDDSLAGLRLFLSGAADTTSDFPESRTAWLKENRRGAMRSGPYLGTYYYALNTARAPFDKVEIRRALTMAVDREWLASRLSVLSPEPAYGVVPPDLLDGQAQRPDWANWPIAKRRAAAKALLARHGYGPAKPLRFELRINSSAEHRRFAVALAGMWAEIGVEATILNAEASLHFASLSRGDYQMGRSGWIADWPAPENFLSVHVCGSEGGNYTGYCNPGFDAALAKALAQPDAAKRRLAMARIDQQLMADAPIIPLTHYVTRALVSPRLGGWHDNPGNVHPSVSLTLPATRATR